MSERAGEETRGDEEAAGPSRLLGEKTALRLGLAALLIVVLVCLLTLVHIIVKRY
jgi:hypothetical protein